MTSGLIKMLEEFALAVALGGLVLAPAAFRIEAGQRSMWMLVQFPDEEYRNPQASLDPTLRLEVSQLAFSSLLG